MHEAAAGRVKDGGATPRSCHRWHWEGAKWGVGWGLQEVESHRARPPSALTDDPITAWQRSQATRAGTDTRTQLGAGGLRLVRSPYQGSDQTLCRSPEEHKYLDISLWNRLPGGRACVSPDVPRTPCASFQVWKPVGLMELLSSADLRNMKQNNKRPLTHLSG